MKLRIMAFCLLALLIACASPQKSFQKGNYEKAYSSALKELEKQNDLRKNKTILNRSFNELLNKFQVENEKLMARNGLEDMESAYLNNLEMIERYIDGKRYLKPEYEAIIQDIRMKNQLLQEDLSETFYEMGLERMEVFDRTSDKIIAQDAHFFFVKADDYRASFENLDSLIEVSYHSGIVHMLVETNSWDRRYSWDIDNRFRDVINYSDGFLKVHYENRFSVADCRIEINFNDIDVYETVNNHRENFSAQIQDGYDTVVDSLGNTQKIPRYKTVRGTVDTRVVNRRYDWRMRANVRNISPFCELNNASFRTEELLILEDYILSGDLRAIPQRYKSHAVSDFRHHEDRLMDNMIDDLYRQFTGFYF